MVRHRGIIKKLSTDKESSLEVYKQLIAEGKIEDKWHELDDDGTPRYLDTDNYTVVGDCIFDITGAPREYDGEDDVNDAERLNETDYRIHSYFYNGGASLAEMLDESIPKADANYQVSEDLEKELDEIMEDLIVGHNFDYARGALLKWHEKHKNNGKAVGNEQ